MMIRQLYNNFDCDASLPNFHYCSTASPSPGGIKLAPRMTTLHEETHTRAYHQYDEVEEEDEELDNVSYLG